MLTKDAMILAAGFGSRLAAEEGHKLLVELQGKTMLQRHLENFSRLGVTRLMIVTGHKGQALAQAAQTHPIPAGISLEFAHNPHFDGPNGWSVLAGAEALWRTASPSPFWLTMSDHLFEPHLFDDLARHFPNNPGASWDGALLIDRKLDQIFDMPDATKLRLDTSPFAIGKDLEDFDAIDTGLFWCDEEFVNALRAQRHAQGPCSTSDAVKTLHQKGRFHFWDIHDRLWQDVDTPGAREHALKLLDADFQQTFK